MAKYIATRNIRFNGGAYAPGDELEASGVQAQRLVALGALEEAPVKAKPKPVQPQQPKAAPAKSVGAKGETRTSESGSKE